jgi:hypothetical protein
VNRTWGAVVSLETYWNENLAYTISPRSGPLRQLQTLRDVSDALQADLPKAMLRRPDWIEVGILVVQASESGAPRDVRVATDHLVDLIERHGWMDRPRLAR